MYYLERVLCIARFRKHRIEKVICVVLCSKNIPEMKVEKTTEHKY